MGTDRLVIHGAREHNLKNVTLDLPRDKLIVFTGLSGSGKSSLAFDTIYAEGQRRYVESLSSYARQFLGQMEKPDVDFIEGLSPAISIDQKSTSQEPPVDGRHDHRDLRLPAGALRPGRPPALPEVRPPDRPPDARADRRPGHGAPRGHAVPGAGARRAGPQGRVRASCWPTWRGKGFARARDRRRGARPRRADPADRELQAHHRGRRGPAGRQARHPPAGGRLDRDRARAGRGHRLDRASRPTTAARRSRPSPRSSPAPYDGISLRRARAPQLLVQLAVRGVPDVRRARHPARGRPRARRPRPRPVDRTRARSRPWASATLRVLVPRARGGGRGARLRRRHAVEASCPKAQREILLYGSDEQIHVRYRNRYGRQRSYYTTYEGVIPNVERRHEETESDTQRDKLEQFMREIPCRACKGARLKPEIPGRHGRRAQHLPSSPICRSATRRTFVDDAGAVRARAHDRRAAAEGDPRAAAVPGRRGAGLPDARPAPPARWPAARRSGSGWPRRSAAAWSACSTSSTSPRSACTSATTGG